ncbi:alpha/beta fold hydrolase [Naasia lichenicola]|uniref:Alpha/beta fold hydrolase n=1 Tax=Naasia lichenicola TaxID=2565933 RepID=A0A4S4FRP6_9MICO|nr:alpha/beta fold hydrolase [Naasia lichenicola]THG33339.1 alpha/beta fold hydrolase [Naasia lichenicola]
MRTERRAPLGPRRPRALVATSAAIALLALLGGTGPAGLEPANAQDSSIAPTPPTITDEPIEAMVPLPAGPGEDGEVHLDTSLYLPKSIPAPMVLLAHGFGGSKDDLNRQARTLRDLGYVVLTYSARGFGRSDGKISLDSVDHEVADASGLIDYVVDQGYFVADSGGGPEVAVVGGSYGGALALMLGATDPRVDAVVAAITWNDLESALVPNSVVPAGDDRSSPAPLLDSQPGVFKEAWASQLFGQATFRSDSACGEFTAELCALYSRLVAGDPLSPDDEALLADSSPSSVLDRMSAPTLLLQGTRDSLFGLDQADANARQIAAAGAPVDVVWFSGGHDSGAAASSGQASIEPTIEEFLAKHLPLTHSSTGPPLSPEPDPQFSYTVPGGATASGQSLAATSYPGIDDAADAVTSTEIEIRSRPRTIVNPPGGLPAAITTLPALGALLGTLGSTAAISLPQDGQTTWGFSRSLRESTTMVGSPTFTMSVARPVGDDAVEGVTEQPNDAVLYAALYSVNGDSRTLVGGTVAPVRVRNVPADGSPVDVEVALPAAAWQFSAGSRIELWVATTDALYQSSPDAAGWRVNVRGTLSLPTVPQSALTESRGVASPLALGGIAAVLLVAIGLGIAAMIRGRRRGVAAAAAGTLPTVAETSASAAPLVLTGLVKNFRNGQRAVDELSFRVETGQVLGLLGPNGAGKTTTLRMAVGLLRPDAGYAEIFGERIVPGAAVLTRVGTFIEGPGFLPHLSGRRNLELFWAASGRAPQGSRIDEALAIADLGAAIERSVRGYSQGMRQRLAIAQAMLGMPELLILDEPTNGLDPPQIHALRGVLRRYADSGRTVIVSSHLLGEVEQTCSHVVVMARGRLIASGTVAELAGEVSEVTIEVTDAEQGGTALEPLGLPAIEVLSPTSLRLLPGETSVETIVSALVAAGVGVRGIRSGRHLEETFLELVGTGEQR